MAAMHTRASLRVSPGTCVSISVAHVPGREATRSLGGRIISSGRNPSFPKWFYEFAATYAVSLEFEASCGHRAGCLRISVGTLTTPRRSGDFSNIRGPFRRVSLSRTFHVWPAADCLDVPFPPCWILLLPRNERFSVSCATDAFFLSTVCISLPKWRPLTNRKVGFNSPTYQPFPL